MGVQSTVVFADLSGSMGVFESLGNVKATEAVTQATQWIAKKITGQGGQVVKFLGDGVMSIFDESSDAVVAVVEIQRSYQRRRTQLPRSHDMPLRIGIACGDVELVGDDCYGDAVNIAARLSELTSPHQIWVDSVTVQNSSKLTTARFRLLGPIAIRGRTEPCTVYQVEWHEDLNSEFFTVPAPMSTMLNVNSIDVLGCKIELSWIGNRKSFIAFELPIHIGRIRTAEFVVSDPRVSRTHVRLDWRNGSVVLVDVSSYGCWVRFAGGGADLLLRREECVLHGRGEIALGAAFSDPSAPVVTFSVS